MKRPDGLVLGSLATALMSLTLVVVVAGLERGNTATLDAAPPAVAVRLPAAPSPGALAATEPEPSAPATRETGGAGGAPQPPTLPKVWRDLADCESGDRLGGVPVEGSARWWYGDPEREHPSWGYDLFHGGLQFHPPTWDWVAGSMGLLDRYPTAWQAPPEVQVLVAMETQRRQGWEAWPNCARIIGLLP